MAENRMELFVETLTGAAFELKVSPFETIMSIKAKIQYLEGIPIAQQHLIWQTQELEDEFCLQDYSITDGATLKLVLGMRGGPINTRRVSVESRQIQDISDYVEGNSDEISERLSSGQPLTVLVFHDGDKVHMYTVIDRTDSNISRLSGSVSETSIKNLTDEEVDEETIERRKENEITRQKMALLQQQMQSLSIKKTSRRKAQVAPVIKSKSPTSEKIPENVGDKHLRLPPLNPENKTVTVNMSNGIKSESENSQDREIVGESCRLLPLVGVNNLNSSIRSHKSSHKLGSGLSSHMENKSCSSSSKETKSNSSYMLNPNDSASSNSNTMQGLKQTISTESLPYLPPAPQSNVQSFRKSKRNLLNFQPHNSTKLLTLRPTYKTIKCSVTGTPSMANRRLLELDQWLNSRPKTTPSKEDQNYNIKWDVRMTSPLKFGSKERNLQNPHRVGLGALVAAGLRVIKSPEENEACQSKSKVTNKPDSREGGRPRSGQKLPPLKGKKKSCKRCAWCNKKTGLATSYVCRCGKNFCARHRYAEVHHCSYDYKTEGRRFLQQSNPVVTAPKLPKI
ncbi:AN1-type zinc finger protein 4-like isoform X2 [Centruroides vittatus]|uniref:AN1-type zinc finger protein 4-like isoform X2 n=1 Tax=Centruroides vittatus TaxID=120091 RepID=UPI00350EB905